MISFYVTDIKKAMHLLLKETTFDPFEVRNVEIQTYVRLEINGSMDKDYLDSTEEEKENMPIFSPWKKIKPVVYEIIKGSKSPKTIKIIFSIPSKQVPKYTNEASALFINFLFKDNKIMISTGSAMKNFILNKDYDILWDEHVFTFFKNQNLPIEKNQDI